jgi:hypothetical protein
MGHTGEMFANIVVIPQPWNFPGLCGPAAQDHNFYALVFVSTLAYDHQPARYLQLSSFAIKVSILGNELCALAVFPFFLLIVTVRMLRNVEVSPIRWSAIIQNATVR